MFHTKTQSHGCMEAVQGYTIHSHSCSCSCATPRNTGLYGAKEATATHAKPGASQGCLGQRVNRARLRCHAHRELYDLRPDDGH